mmetsp:Transcript_27757/g.54497  ORF Transcript_27757/g.54497 Transcript_27757/m.54497 type:complete len:107 (-) Transcript_27757:242-562(-)
MAATWSTGLCACCAEPGGCGLCVRGTFCPCTLLGDIHERVGGKFLIGCLLCPCSPCIMANDVPQVAEKAGFEEGGVRACCCSICVCAPCYTCQVWRETEIKEIGKK